MHHRDKDHYNDNFPKRQYTCHRSTRFQSRYLQLWVVSMRSQGAGNRQYARSTIGILRDDIKKYKLLKFKLCKTFLADMCSAFNRLTTNHVELKEN
jgi:hypothetical protein